MSKPISDASGSVESRPPDSFPKSTRQMPSPESPGKPLNQRTWKTFFGPSWDTAVALAVMTLLVTGLFRGGCYSSQLAYRQQTDAFFRGTMKLGDNARAVAQDLAWDNGAVQHVWGLGVPAWRAPFEILARIFGAQAFPDRLAFGVALALVIYICLRFHWRTTDRWCPGMPEKWVAVASLSLILSPVLLTLCLSKFEVYEEVVAYAVLAGLVAMIWTANIYRKPNVASFAGLCLFAGLLPFIRPTFLFYGISSVTVGGLALWRKGKRLGALVVGFISFSFGIGLLMWTNAVRFGSPLEFGHQLNAIPQPPMIYAARFDNPYRTECHDSLRMSPF